MGTKSRESIYGASVGPAAERARDARLVADRMACESWNKRMLAFRGPAQPPPALGDALNAGCYRYLEVRCHFCDTSQTAALDAVRRPMATLVQRGNYVPRVLEGGAEMKEGIEVEDIVVERGRRPHGCLYCCDEWREGRASPSPRGFDRSGRQRVQSGRSNPMADRNKGSAHSQILLEAKWLRAAPDTSGARLK